MKALFQCRSMTKLDGQCSNWPVVTCASYRPPCIKNTLVMKIPLRWVRSHYWLFLWSYSNYYTLTAPQWWAHLCAPQCATFNHRSLVNANSNRTNDIYWQCSDSITGSHHHAPTSIPIATIVMSWDYIRPGHYRLIAINRILVYSVIWSLFSSKNVARCSRWDNLDFSHSNWLISCRDKTSSAINCVVIGPDGLRWWRITTQANGFEWRCDQHWSIMAANRAMANRSTIMDLSWRPESGIHCHHRLLIRMHYTISTMWPPPEMHSTLKTLFHRDAGQ